MELYSISLYELPQFSILLLMGSWVVSNLGLTTGAARGMVIHVFWWTCGHLSVAYLPRMRRACVYSAPAVCQAGFQWSHQFTLPTEVYEGSSSSAYLPTLFHLNHSGGYVVILHYGSFFFFSSGEPFSYPIEVIDSDHMVCQVSPQRGSMKFRFSRTHS